MSVSLRALRSTLIALATAASVGCSSDMFAPEPVAEPTPNQLLGLGKTVRGLGNTLGNTVNNTLNTVNNLLTGLVACTPLQNSTVTKKIGPQGGTISVGQFTLTIPAGALSQTKTIVMQQVADTVNSVRFAPHGLQFAQSATLTMGYSNCLLALQTPKPVRILYVTETLQQIEAPLSVDNQVTNKVSAEIDHFSRYAIAW